MRSKYIVAYTASSVGLFAWAVYDLLARSTEALAFLVEITDGYKMGILLNTMVVVFSAAGLALFWATFGALRLIELEHVVERMPVFVLNLLFNLVTDDNLVFNCMLLGLAVVSKVFHIVLVDRFDFVHLKTANAADAGALLRRQVLRRVLALGYFWALPAFAAADFGAAKFLVYDVFKGVNSVTCLLFGFQYAVQAVEMVAYWCRAMLNVYEVAWFRAGGGTDDDDDAVWEHKPYYTKAVNIVALSLKAVLHIAFIYLLTMASHISLPILMVQGTYLSVAQTYREVVALVAFVEALRKLDSMLPDATAAELAALDTLCIICREDMHALDVSARRTPKRLACGHIIHMGCLKDWLERLEICPLCRRKVFQTEAEVQREAAERQRDRDREAAVLREIAAPAPAPVPAPAPAPAPAPPAATAAPTNAPSQASANELFGAEASSSCLPLPLSPAPGPTLCLPHGVRIPPDWTPLPLQRHGDAYRVTLASSLTAHLDIRPNTH